MNPLTCLCLSWCKLTELCRPGVELCFSLFHTGVGQVNETTSANAVEDAAAVSAISKQQILVQYLKASIDVYSVLCPYCWLCAVSEIPPHMLDRSSYFFSFFEICCDAHSFRKCNSHSGFSRLGVSCFMLCSDCSLPLSLVNRHLLTTWFVDLLLFAFTDGWLARPHLCRFATHIWK